MNRDIYCDFCGAPGTRYQHLNQHGQRELEMDEDCLWVCSECKAKLISQPTAYLDDDGCEVGEDIKALMGKNAGAICRTMGLPYESPYQSIIDAASRIVYDEDRYMSAWSFVALWMDGTTVWLSPDRIAKALVYEDGRIQIEDRK